MSAIGGSGGLQHLCELGGQAGVAGFLSRAGKFVAVFKISQLIFYQDHVVTEEQVFVYVVCNVIVDRTVPSEALSGAEGRGSLFHGFQFYRGSRIAFLRTRRPSCA